MKETTTLQHLHFKIERYARNLLTDAGYEILPDLPDIKGDRPWQDKPGEQGLSVQLSVVGYSRRYDGWDYELSQEDWETIFSINWDEDTLRLLKFMQENGNVNLAATKVRDSLGLSLSWNGSVNDGTWINKQFARNRLPYHFGITHREPSRKNGYPFMIRMFKRPVPIDVETADEESEN